MRGFVANTDYDWYSFLGSQPGIDEVNFWKPSGGSFGAVPVGSPFFFRLKAPHNAIAGFGYFASSSVLPAWLAWEAFQVKNGASDFTEMRRRIEKYRNRFKAQSSSRAGDYDVGCVMIAAPVFFPRELWVPDADDWAPNIVTGKTYSLTEGEGLRIFTDCVARAEGLPGAALVAEDAPRYGKPVEISPRLGQGIFRVGVLDAYGRACAVTGEHSLPVLEAAHIKPYAEGGAHSVDNGVLLRSDVHKLFDLGYVTVTPDYAFRISDALREEYNNGRAYYEHQGDRLHLPSDPASYPSRELLDWHGQAVYRG